MSWLIANDPRRYPGGDVDGEVRMTGLGYSSVPLVGFAGFGEVLQEGTWATIAVPDVLLRGPLDLAALDRLGTLAQWKVRLQRATHAAVSISAAAQPLAELDATWDNAQHRLALLVEFAECATNPAMQAAGTRLRARLMPPVVGVNAPTLLAYTKEVYYGQAQIAAARQPNVQADIALAGLSECMSQVTAATYALAEGIGLTGGTSRLLTNRAEVRATRTVCVSVFNRVHGDMEWLLANSAESPWRSTVAMLCQSLTDLLSLYPLPAPTSRKTATATPPTASSNLTPTATGIATSVGAAPTPLAITGSVSGTGNPTLGVTVPVAPAPKPRRSARKATRGTSVRHAAIKPMAKALPPKKIAVNKPTKGKKRG